MSTPIIQVEGLSRVFQTYKKKAGLFGAVKGLFHREYEQTVAVRNISFSVEEGEIVGFLGPNGAGKTTTLKMLSGLLHPSSGSASVLGYTPWKRPIAYRRQFALLLGQKNQLWWDLPARESLELNGRIYGIPRRHMEHRVAELSQLLQVEDKLDVMVRELSLGERMKFELIAALLHRPKVLFLDEPTLGLDVVAQRAVREFLRAYNETFRTTVLLTSHYMSDIEALCRRVIIIDNGRLFFDGSLEEVVDRFADSKLVTIHLEEEFTVFAGDLAGFGHVLENTPGRIKLQVPRSRLLPVCRGLLQSLPVADLNVEEVPIEDVVRNLFTRGETGQEDGWGFQPRLVAA
ncbi:MAG: ABC transporter ATP-binding protein [Verrucomicrobiales bacterium]|nr:ABC transporter ATP-binding protein [Verrucomicrobiales bacterium]